MVQIHGAAHAGAVGEHVSQLAEAGGFADPVGNLIPIDGGDGGRVDDGFHDDLAVGVGEEVVELVEGDHVAVFGADLTAGFGQRRVGEVVVEDDFRLQRLNLTAGQLDRRQRQPMPDRPAVPLVAYRFVVARRLRGRFTDRTRVIGDGVTVIERIGWGVAEPGLNRLLVVPQEPVRQLGQLGRLRRLGLAFAGVDGIGGIVGIGRIGGFDLGVISLGGRGVTAGRGRVGRGCRALSTGGTRPNHRRRRVEGGRRCG